MPFQSYVVQMSVSGGQWSTLTTISDVSQSTYTVTGLSPALYQFRMYDQVGTSGQYGSTSNVINVNIPLPVTVQISSSTTSLYVGQQVLLTASASGGTNSYSYQWYSNGNPIDGATSASYTYYPSNAGIINIYATAKDNQDSTLAIATSNSISLTATTATTVQPTQSPNNPTQQPNNPTQPPNTNDNGNTNTTSSLDNQGLPIVTIAVIAIIVAVAVIGGVLAIIFKQKSAKKPNTQ
jgi:hypothetical protein